MASFFDNFKRNMAKAISSKREMKQRDTVTVPGQIVSVPEKPEKPAGFLTKPSAGIHPYPAGYKGGMNVAKKQAIYRQAQAEEREKDIDALKSKRIVPSREIKPKIGWGQNLFGDPDGFDFTANAREIAKAKLEMENMLRQAYDENTKSFRISCSDEF